MRKQTRRKVYSLVNPITYAITGATITDRKALDKLRMLEWSALEAMIKGKATVNDWRILVDVLNLTETAARNGIGPEVLPICEKAQEALHKAAMHYEKTKRLVLTGQGIQAIRELIEYADLQQSSISRSELERMITKTKNYIAAGKNVVEIT